MEKIRKSKSAYIMLNNGIQIDIEVASMKEVLIVLTLEMTINMG